MLPLVESLPLGVRLSLLQDVWSLMVPSSPEIFSESLQKLVRKFDADKHHYLSKDYLEAEARVDFVTSLYCY